MPEEILSRVYNADEIFEDIEGDPDNVLLKIPDEFIQRLGWNEGDVINLEVVDGAIYLKNLTQNKTA